MMHLRGDTRPLCLVSPHYLDKARHGKGSSGIAVLDVIIPLNVVCWHEVADCPLPGKHRMKAAVDRRNCHLVGLWVVVDGNLASVVEVISSYLEKLLSHEMVSTRILTPSSHFMNSLRK